MAFFDLSSRINRMLSFETPPALGPSPFNIENNYHEDDNPQGIIQLAMAENRLLGDLMVEKVRTVDLTKVSKSTLVYQDGRGMADFRRVLAEFLADMAKAPQKLDPDKIRVCNGVLPLIANLLCIICDEGDTILIPTPCFGGIMEIMGHHPNVKYHPVPLSNKPGCDKGEEVGLTVEQLESSYQEAQQNGCKVRALFLINPLNPQGTLFTREQVVAYLNFCKRHELHAILDEIYLAGIYDHGNRPSSSILSIPEKDIPDLERAHFLWGISKDFAYASSHCSVLYSHNEGVLQGVSMLSDYHTVSSLTQVALTQILGDKEWVHGVYLPAFCRRLQEARDAVTTALDKLGVEYVHPRAGLYVWMNLVKYMGCSTAEEECSLCLHLVSCGLHIHPSSRFYGDEPGWFRMIISAPMPELREALKRLSTGLLSYVPNATSDKP